MKLIGHYLNSPFKKWDGDKIVNIFNKNGFIFDNEYAGIFLIKMDLYLIMNMLVYLIFIIKMQEKEINFI